MNDIFDTGIIENTFDDIENVPDKKDIFDNFIEFRLIWNKKLQKFAFNIKDFENLVDCQVEILSAKAELINERTILTDGIIYLVRNLKIKKEEQLLQVRQNQLRVKNQSEQNVILDSNLADDELEIEKYNNQLNYINGIINTIDNMIFAIKDRVKIYELQNF